jgi:hypothetical protein
MPIASNPNPSVQAAEILNYGFDFSTPGFMAPNTTIITAVVTLATVSGNDPMPQNRVNGVAVIQGLLVVINIGPCIGTVTYRRSCVITASDGQVYEVYTTFYCEP